QIVVGAIAAGLPPAQAEIFTTPPKTAQIFETLVSPRDLLLVKRSHGVQKEQNVDAPLSPHAPPPKDSRPQGRPQKALLTHRRSVAALLQPAERFSLHHGSHGLRQLDRDVSGACLWSVADSPFA